MDPAAASSRAGRTLRPMRPLRRVLLAAVAGAAWLTLTCTAAQADDACAFYGTADDAGESAAAASCTDADDLPVPSLDGVVSVDIPAVPAGTWAAGAVPGPGVASADVVPADPNGPADTAPDPAVPDRATARRPGQAAPDPALPSPGAT